MSNTPSLAPDAAVPDLAARAIDLAQRWVKESVDAEISSSAGRRATVWADPGGLPFTVGFVDGVMRPESLSAAASGLHRLTPLVPKSLPWYLRGALLVGGSIAQVLPTPVVPMARRALRDMVGHLVVDARPGRLGAAMATLSEGGARVSLRLLGEAVLGERAARRRLDAIHDLMRRPDLDRVSVTVSTVVRPFSLWAFEEYVEEAVQRLMPLYLTALENNTFITLEFEEYRELDLTITVFTRILEDPRLRELDAGIMVPTCLSDALPALQQLTAWAAQRVEGGGAPVRVRLVKGAHLVMERVDAVMHDWPLATYDDTHDVEANHLRCLDFALTPEHTAAVRVVVAGNDLFDIAYAWLLAGEREVRDAVEFEMLLGVAKGQLDAVIREVGQVLLDVPAVRPDQFDVAIGFLLRRLNENASRQNLASAAQVGDPTLFKRESDRFMAAWERASDEGLRVGPNRTQNRPEASFPGAAHQVGGQKVGTYAPAGGDTEQVAAESPDFLTQAVLGIGQSAAGEGAEGETEPVGPTIRSAMFGGQEFVETAVFSLREVKSVAVGAPGFRQAADSDPALPANRAWARGILSRVESSVLGDTAVAAARVEDAARRDDMLQRVRTAARSWGALPATERSAVLSAVAQILEARRGELIEVALSETGKVFAEADVEISEAIDFANYYAATARELDRVSGAIFVPSRLTVVASPWNSPISIPAGGMLAALVAGSGVVLAPSPLARRCAAVLAEALWDAGVPRDLLALAEIDEGPLGQHLIAHPDVDRVILTGSHETAALWRSWRPELPLLANTGSKNAMIVMPSADLDLAASDLVKSAFAHAGQTRSAASLAILVGPVGRSKRFARQLIDAATSLRVGAPHDPLAEIGPMIEPPQGELAWALTTLDSGEQWLVKPERVDCGVEFDGRCWTPGIRTGVRPESRMLREEFFGPVLAVMHASSLSQAIELHNTVTSGLTAGLHTQNPDDLATWVRDVDAGNLYVNRSITGAIVQRQPFGGWKSSSVGAGAKTGGPNYLIGLGSWRASSGASASSTLHLRGLDSRISTIIEAAQPSLSYEAFEWLRRSALSDALQWDREFGQVRDVSRLGVERNLLRYRPIEVAVRATGDALWQALLRVVIAGVRAGSSFTVSAPVGLPAPVRRALSDENVVVFVETDQQWLERMRGVEGAATRPPRARLVGTAESVAALHLALAAAVAGDLGLAIYANEVTTTGRLELLPFLREQSISITAHRFGAPDPWSEAVI